MSEQYARARSIRNTSFGDLISKNIMNNRGVASSVGSAISNKFVSKVIGIKEHFDPINVAKRITGNLGATLVGKMLGRSNRDISYFTGIHGTKNEDPLYTKISDGQNQRMRKGDALADVVAKLYNITKKYHLEDIERMEMERNFSKTRQEETENWQKEVLSELLGVKKLSVVPTAKVEEKKSGSTIGSKLGKMIFDFLKSGPFLSLMGVLAVGAVGVALAAYLKNKAEEATEKQAREMGGPEAERAMKQLHQERPQLADDMTFNQTPEGQENVQKQIQLEQKVSQNVQDKQAIVQRLMLEKGYKKYWVKNFGIVTGISYDDKNGKSAPPELLKQVSDQADEIIQSAKLATPTKAAPPVLENNTSTATPTASKVQKSSAEMLTPPSTTTATPSPPQSNPIGQKVQQVISDNNNLQMESSGGKTVVIDNSKNVNKGVNAPSTTSMPGSAPVRNDDDTTAAVQRANYRPV